MRLARPLSPSLSLLSFCRLSLQAHCVSYDRGTPDAVTRFSAPEREREREREREKEEEGGGKVYVTTAFIAGNEIFLITFSFKTKIRFVYLHIIVQPTKVTIEDIVDKF